MATDYEITVLDGSEKKVSGSLSDSFENWKDNEKFLFVSPHDDDALIGGGLLMQIAVKAGADVAVLIVTDGSMGYCDESEIDTISSIRKKEAVDAYCSIGVNEENIHWVGLPDCRVNLYRGKIPANRTEPGNIEGFTGLQNSFTYFLRKLKPTRLLVPTDADLHPDHKYVHEELLISVFHASGAIWPELGQPYSGIDKIYEMAVYCDFPDVPDIQLKTSEECLKQKISGIEAYVSQKQIASLVENIRANGPYEFFRSVKFKLYNPLRYVEYFANR